LLPVLGTEFQYTAFYRSMKLVGFAAVVRLFRKHGRPRWNQEYGRELFQDDDSSVIFFALAISFAAPFFVPVAIVGLRCILSLCRALKRMASRLPTSLHRVVDSGCSKVTSRSQEIAQLIAQFEMMTAIVMVIQLIMGYQYLIATIMYLHFVRIRYMLSYQLRVSFGNLRQSLDGYLLSPRCPQIIQRLYLKIQSFLSTMVDPQAQSQAPRCSIM